MAARKKKNHHHKENNKLLFILFIFFAFLLVLVYLSVDFKKEKSYTRPQVVRAINEARVDIPDTSVTTQLSDGKATFEVEGAEGAVMISDPIYYFESNDGYDVFSVMTVNSGGSGEFVNIGMFRLVDGEAIFMGSSPVGDRVVVTDITRGEDIDSGYVVNVNYLDREEGAPMVEAPSVETTATFSVVNGMIEETK